MVSQNLQERQVLHLPPCHRVPEPQVRRHFPHPHLVPGVGELPFSLHGRMGILGGGAVAGADSQCQDTAFPHDLPGALLGDDGGRFHPRHQQSRRAESARSRQQPRPSGHLRGGIGTVQLPHREAHQQEETAQIRRDYRRAAHHLYAWAGQPHCHRPKQQGSRHARLSGFQPAKA